MTRFFVALYLLTLLLPLLTYVFYPIVLRSIGRVVPFRPYLQNIMPHVSVIIPAYNEAKSIERKIENTLALHYPKDKIEILVGSDGSTDGTPLLAARFAHRGVKTVSYPRNRGKTAVQNDLVEESKGEILIFTDAASFVESRALSRITRYFADDRVGCVAGRMRYVDVRSNINTQSQGLYWRYESAIRDMESRLGRLIGVDGPLYAVRRECYVSLAENVISDFITPLLVLAQGKRVVWEPEALVDEDPTRKASEEFNTRRRIALRGLVGLLMNSRLLNVLKYPGLASQIIFHKLLRWFVGIIIVVNLMICLILSTHWFFQSILVFYFAFFVAATLGWLSEHLSIRASILTVPYYFSLVNLAATMGILDFLRRKQVTAWKPVRH
jgi:cellulose synthase/poly-beta-1,6-N-acetylglucosamine synthase-like glycosyltransferase